tara:strand:- start:515 stop:703 length:189 start_codon:yes stop_codon:yes gene_type:complete
MDETNTQVADPNAVWIPLEEVEKFVAHIRNMLVMTIESIDGSMEAVKNHVNNEGENNDDNQD